MATKEELKKKAYDLTAEGVVDETAIYLKKKYELLKAALPDKNWPNVGDKPGELNAAEFRRMAREAIRDRQFKIRESDTAPITLEEINDKLQANPDAKRTLEALGAKHVKELVPNPDQQHRIATAASEGVAANLSGNGGESWGNTISGGWSYVSSFGYSSATETVANNFRASTVANLHALNAADPKMKLFLTQENIDFAGDSVKTSVIEQSTKSTTKPIDRVKEAKPEELDDAQRTGIAQGIYRATYDATRAGIDAEIEKGYNSGFMGSIARMLGPDISNMLIGILNFFIKMFGGTGFDYIPSENEVHNASYVVGKAVSEVFTGQNIPKDPAKAAEAVKNHVKASLEANKERYPSFSPKQIEEMAIKAGEGAAAKFDQIPKISSAAANPAQATKLVQIDKDGNSVLTREELATLDTNHDNRITKDDKIDKKLFDELLQKGPKKADGSNPTEINLLGNLPTQTLNDAAKTKVDGISI